METVCIQSYGCVSQYITCTIENNTAVRVYANDSSSSNSSVIAGCLNSVCRNDTCVLVAAACVNYSPQVIIGSAIGAGILAGIIIGVIAALCLAGGGGILAYNQYQNSEGLASVHQNPLFIQPGTGGDNPLHEGN